MLTKRRKVNQILGCSHSAKCLLYSVDFEEIENHSFTNQWDKIADLLSEAAITLETTGREVIVICTDTLHNVISGVERKIQILILHITEAADDKIIEKRSEKVGFLQRLAERKRGRSYNSIRERYYNC